MISNGKDITTPQKAQVCVIGSGPAGITAAWELSKTGLDVILLDGGRQLDYSVPDYYPQSWPDKVKLYNGVADGEFSNYETDFLILPYDGDDGSAREPGTCARRDVHALGWPVQAFGSHRLREAAGLSGLANYT